MWDLIVSVPDHCLSFYLHLRRHCNSGPWSFNTVHTIQKSGESAKPLR